MPSQVLTRQNADSAQLTELRTAALAQLADDIRALLAERDGLKATLDAQKEAALDLMGEKDAALADALGLLRELRDWKPEPPGYRIITFGDPNSWTARRDALLAKHGPSP